MKFFFSLTDKNEGRREEKKGKKKNWLSACYRQFSFSHNIFASTLRLGLKKLLTSLLSRAESSVPLPSQRSVVPVVVSLLPICWTKSSMTGSASSGCRSSRSRKSQIPSTSLERIRLNSTVLSYIFSYYSVAEPEPRCFFFPEPESHWRGGSGSTCW